MKITKPRARGRAIWRRSVAAFHQDPQGFWRHTWNQNHGKVLVSEDVTVVRWPSTVTQLQAGAWKPIITVAVIHIICCSPESVEVLSVLVTLPQLVDVQANVESPLLFERSCRRLSLTAYSSVSRPPDPHRARRPGCKRSRSSLYVAEMNSWQRSVPLGSAVRCQSQRGGERTFAWVIVCWRKMDEVGVPFYYSSHSKQNSSLCFDSQIFHLWTPPPAVLYRILTPDDQPVVTVMSCWWCFLRPFHSWADISTLK